MEDSMNSTSNSEIDLEDIDSKKIIIYLSNINKKN